jgi:predicted nucleic acid-binding protein
MSRALVDSDILVMGFLDARGGAGRVVDAWLAGLFELCCARAQVEEVGAILKRAELTAFVEPTRAEQFLNDLELRSEALHRIRLTDRVDDPASNALLGLATAAAVEVLVVTESSPLRQLGMHGEVRIRSARDFVVWLAAG